MPTQARPTATARRLIRRCTITGVYADVSGIVAGQTIDTTDVTTPINQLDTALNALATGATAFTGLSVNGAVTLDGGAFVFNEASADYDARFEGANDANLLVLDANVDVVGIGVAAGSIGGKLHVKSTTDDQGLIVQGNATQTIALVEFRDSAAAVLVSVSGTGGAVFNEQGNDADFRVEGDTNANLIFADASTDRVGIGTNAPTVLLDVNGAVQITGALVFNEAGGDVDARFEGDSLSHMLFLDASAATENIALLAGAAPNWQSMDGGIFIANASAVPTGNPTGGGFFYVEAGALKYRGTGGTVTTVGPA